MAEAYRLAFNGSTASAVDALDDKIRARDPIDRVHLGCAKTHVLYLAGRSDEALQTIEKEVLPLVDQFAPKLREVVDFNRTIVANDCGDFPTQAEMDRHHALVDRRASVGFKSGAPSKLLDADSAAAEGKLYDALPIYTSAFYKAFDTYDWSAWKAAAGRLSGAVLQFGDVSQATFYAFVSENSGVIERLARHLIARNDPASIDKALDILKRKANLKRHRLMAFKLVASLGQAVPDHAAAEWSDQCRSYRHNPIDGWRAKSMFDIAWEVSSVVAPALSTEAADLLAEDALNHPLWHDAVLRQQSFYPALYQVGPNLSDAVAARVIHSVASCARPPLEPDFEAAAFLLAELYDRRATQRDFIRGALFPSAQDVPAHLARMAERFHVETPVQDFEMCVRRAHERLDHQIRSEDKKTHVAIGQDINALLLVDACKERLQQEQVDHIVARMLDLIEHPRNVNDNRARMIECAAFLIDKVGIETGRRAARLYAKYAADHRVEGHPLYGQAEAEHPLNAFRVGGLKGWPQDVRGEALIAMGTTSSRADLVEDIDLDGLLYAALDDPNPTVRRDACIAVTRSNTMFRDLLRVVLIRAADPATEVANVALRVLAHRSKDVADLSLAGAALAVARTQGRHDNPVVRTAAAEVTASLRDLPPTTLTAAEHRQLEAVANRLSTDVARAVRQKLSISRMPGAAS